MEKKWWKSKTLCTALATVIMAGLDLYGYNIPKGLYIILGSLAITFLRISKEDITK